MKVSMRFLTHGALETEERRRNFGPKSNSIVRVMGT